eukprot:841176-Pyramimonas_sp.AAC.1
MGGSASSGKWPSPSSAHVGDLDLLTPLHCSVTARAAASANAGGYSWAWEVLLRPSRSTCL